MKVSNKGSGPISSADSTAKDAAAAKGAGKVGAESILDAKKAKGSDIDAAEMSKSARVDVSTKAQNIRKAKELATPSGDIDDAKVMRLQKLIDAGEYRVDADAIADRMLDEHMKMPT